MSCNGARKYSIILTLVCALHVGCVQSIDQVSSRSADRFHIQLDAEKYADIYREADPSLKNKLTESEFVAYLSSVHQRLGRFKRITDSPNSFARFVHNWNFGTAQSSGTMMIRALSEFERGVAVEGFEWDVKGGGASLVSYQCEGPIVAVSKN
jgi:hypothetical protein